MRQSKQTDEIFLDSNVAEFFRQDGAILPRCVHCHRTTVSETSVTMAQRASMDLIRIPVRVELDTQVDVTHFLPVTLINDSLFPAIMDNRLSMIAGNQKPVENNLSEDNDFTCLINMGVM